MIPAAPMALKPVLEDFEPQPFVQPRRHKRTVTPLGDRKLWSLPAKQDRNCTLANMQEFLNDSVRVQRSENFLEIEVPVTLRRDGVEPGARVEFGIAPEAFLTPREAARDANALMTFG
jgi:hypothetical protein